MKRIKSAIVTAVFIGLMSTHSVLAADLDNDTRVALHAELRNYISVKTGDRGYTFFDEDSGTASALRLKKIHPVVFGLEGRYLLCADFIDSNGELVVVDYVVLPTSEGYLIEKEIEGKRSMLTKLFEKFI